MFSCAVGMFFGRGTFSGCCAPYCTVAILHCCHAVLRVRRGTRTAPTRGVVQCGSPTPHMTGRVGVGRHRPRAASSSSTR
jgi:hypothetical protein